MKNEERIKNKIRSQGFIKMLSRDSWTRGSWTIRFYKDDIEIFDDIEKSGYYILGNVKTFNIDPVLEEILGFINNIYR